MKRYFTHYWKNTTWDSQVRGYALESNNELDHTASNMFRVRGISKGDSVYIITVKRGQLFLLCKLAVGHVCGFEKAARLLKTENLWEADDHIVAESPAPIRRKFDVQMKWVVREICKIRRGAGDEFPVYRWIRETYSRIRTFVSADTVIRIHGYGTWLCTANSTKRKRIDGYA